MSRRLAALALATVTACGRAGTSDPPAAVPTGSAAVHDAADNAHYVGGEACRPCHAEIWSTFSRTGMGRSWSPMSTAPVVEDWTVHNTVEVPATGLRYRMARRDGKFFMRQSITDGRGGETAVDERELVWVIGSANHSRTYVVSQNGKLFQAPVCWQTQEPVWDLCPGYELGNLYFARETGRTCVYCHNDRMTLLPDSRNGFVEPIPHGISCERCHGAGGRHVARWERGATPTGQGDPTIVNPRRLPANLRIQICFPCHLGDPNLTERVSLYEAALEDWRPGRPITTAVIPFRFSEKTLHNFGLSGQVDRLVLSRCFRESSGRLECLTCHNPHKTIFREDRPADFFKSKCLDCHASNGCKASNAKRRATTPPDDCVACHMRKGEPDDQRHVLFTDHWIRARIDDPPKPRTRFDVEPFFPELFAELSPADRAFYTARAISLRTKAVPAEVRKGMWPQAETKFREAIAAGFERAEGLHYLDVALTAQGKFRDAAGVAAAAFAKDPGDFDVAFAYAQSLMRQRRVAEAERVFTTIAHDHPEAAGPLAELARARANRQDYAGASELFRKAIALEPWNAAMRGNVAMMLSALDRHAEAIAEMEQALRLDPEGADRWNSYATLLVRAGRPADAAVAAKRARDLEKAQALRTGELRSM